MSVSTHLLGPIRHCGSCSLTLGFVPRDAVNTLDKYEMGTSCCATVGTRHAAASTAAVKSCHNIVQIVCVVLPLHKCRVLGHLTLNNRDRALESIHNIPKFSLRFAEVLRLLFLSRHFQPWRQISRWRHLWEQCWRREFPAGGR